MSLGKQVSEASVSTKTKKSIRRRTAGANGSSGSPSRPLEAGRSAGLRRRSLPSSPHSLHAGSVLQTI